MSFGTPSAEYMVVLHRVLMRLLPEDMESLYRKRTKTDTTGADSTGVSRKDRVKPILKFLQVEVESREEGRV